MLRAKSFQDVCTNPARESKWLSTDRRAALKAHWGNRCAYCQEMLTAATLEFDHVIDGPHTTCHHYTVNATWNVVPSCNYCNSAKGHLPGNWRIFVAHAALNLAYETGESVDAMIAQLTANFTSKLYATVNGYAKDMRSFPGATVLANAYTIEKIDLFTSKINGTHIVKGQ